MSQAFSNGAYQLQNVYFPKLYMTASDIARGNSNPLAVGLPLNANTTVWDFTWYTGSGPNNGGNWTIRNGQTCDTLEPPPSQGGVTRWDIWTQTDGSSIQIAIHDTVLNLGLSTSTNGTSVELLTHVASPDQLYWTYTSVNSSHNCF